MTLPSIEIVLVRTKRGGNIASAARAMKNMGLGRLTLVDACVPDEAERALAYGAIDVLDAARRAPDLRAALADCVFVAGTSSRPCEQEATPRQFAAEAARRAGDGAVAVVFGPEDSGLSNDELRLCHARVRISSDPAHPSLNLAQAVMVIAYELYAVRAESSPAPVSKRATVGELERCFDALTEALRAVGYSNPQNPEAILSELRGLIVRAEPTTREVTLLQGMARQILWAARDRSSREGAEPRQEKSEEAHERQDRSSRGR